MTVKAADPKYVNMLIGKRLVHEVHTSERRSYRGCRRRWSWLFQDFYYPQTTAKPLEFGVAFHDAMEVLYNPDTWDFDKDILMKAAIGKFVEKCTQQKDKYRETVGEMPPEVEEDYKERIALGAGMIEHFATNVAPEWDKGWKPLKVEVEFIVPIQNPDTDEYIFCKCKRCMRTIELWEEEEIAVTVDADGVIRPDEDLLLIVQLAGTLKEQGLPVCLAGRIDMLAEDNLGRYWIVDWKTAARLSRGDASGQEHLEFLELDDQIASYVMALRRKLGLDVRGFVYVEIKKAFPQPPARNLQVRKGCMYSINKQQPVDYETYLKTVKENDTAAYEAGLYDEMLTWLKNDGAKYTNREQIMKTDAELYEIERNLFFEAREMCGENLVIYPSAGRFSCSFCAFRQPCLEQNRQGDYQYILDTMFDRRKTHYWVKELSTEKQGGE